ncbi:hypothetical protein B484DRAFT_441560 [Ochromonadaceae sp. CCMP2298]|nr:hypothetical protein B484DRAFT_441560 [Ochromonadaceae sp. CCMP2298]|mmetsp:Transcript_31152/g.68695  ORF Transcript_31152/g.68695 Transcript_31152/m.68695 type:complete len:276 (-) Transcript_31152:176-1003(-)
MDARPYLDKLVTSPHIPMQPGQKGYCSRKVMPDLSCTGLRSIYEDRGVAVTTADGKMTEEYKMFAYRKMRDLQRGITYQNSEEQIFKLDHRQFIDHLLSDMEKTKRDKHQRHMRYWKKEKAEAGFPDSFERTDHLASAQEGDYDAGSRRVSVNSASIASVASAGSGTSRGSGSRAGYGASAKSGKQSSKGLRRHSTMALFESLLEVTAAPVSPTRERFGSIIHLPVLNVEEGSRKVPQSPGSPALRRSSTGPPSPVAEGVRRTSTSPQRVRINDA